MPKYGTVFQVLLQLVVALLSLLEEIKPFPDRKMINLLTFDDLFPPLRLKSSNDDRYHVFLPK